MKLTTKTIYVKVAVKQVQKLFLASKIYISKIKGTEKPDSNKPSTGKFISTLETLFVELCENILQNNKSEKNVAIIVDDDILDLNFIT